MILLLFYKKESYIYVSGLALKNKEVDLLRQISIDLYRYGIGLVGCIVVIGLLEILYGRMIQKDCKQKKQSQKPLVFERLGLYTLEIYILQRIVLERCFAKTYQYAVKLTGQNILAVNRIIYDFAFTLLCAFVIGIVLLKISEAMSKHPRLSFFLFGKCKRTS